MTSNKHIITPSYPLQTEAANEQETCIKKQRTGTIFFLIGASGAGKDSVLRALRPRIEGYPVVCLHRYITRDVDAGDENHISLTQEEFRFREQSDLFALSWQANDQLYGIGAELDTMLDKGISVLLNGSRGFLKEARNRYPEQLIPILITTSENILYERLQQRGRESSEAIKARLKRAREQHLELIRDTNRKLVSFDNSGSLKKTTDQVFQWLLGQPAITESALISDTIENRVDTIFSLFEKWGHEHYGEEISQLSHALQAAELAKNNEHSEEIILAAFLHDIGHLLVLDKHPQFSEQCRLRHDQTGARYLKEMGFSSKVTSPVAGHVAAKRYLCAVKPSYAESLSKASKESLAFQGGPMSQDDASQFATRPDLEDILALRHWDEQAKETSFTMGCTQWLKDMMVRHLYNNCNNQGISDFA